MLEPNERDISLFNHYRDTSRNELTEQVADFDLQFSALKDLMSEIKQGGIGETLSQTKARLYSQQALLVNEIEDTSDLVLITENDVFDELEGVEFWVGFVHSYETALIKYIQDLCGKKVAEPTDKARLAKQAQAYMGTIQASELDLADRDYIEVMSYEGSDEEDDEDTMDWVIMARLGRINEMVEAFLDHLQLTTERENQAQRQKSRRITKSMAKKALRATAYISLSAAAMQFFKRKKK